MILMLINFAYHNIKTRSSRVRCKSMLLLVPLNVGPILGKYASQLLKASWASYAKGLAPPALCQ